MNIFLKERQVYGATVYYPACDISIKLAALVGTKTLTKQVISKLIDLGYIVQLAPLTPVFTTTATKKEGI